MTCVFCDGQQLSQLFTSNQQFNADRKVTKRTHKKTEEEQARLAELLAQYDISADRICYMAGSAFLAENNDMLYTFLRSFADVFEEKKIETIYSDNGNAFKCESDSVIDLCEYVDLNHVYLPASVHQWLSVCDNMLHGRAKKLLYSKHLDHSDNLLTSIVFLYCLDNVSTESLLGDFDRNLFLDGRQLNVAAVSKLMSKPDPASQEYYFECLQLYKSEVLKVKDGMIADVLPHYNNLDGSYWEKNE